MMMMMKKNKSDTIYIVEQLSRVHAFPKDVRLKVNVLRDWSSNSLTLMLQDSVLAITPLREDHRDVLI